MLRTAGKVLALVAVVGSMGLVKAQNTELMGAGATFPYPLYSKMFDIYKKEFGVKINYQPIGSGGGIKQLESRTVDFGATDAFMSDDELKESSSEIVHIPMCLGSVAVTYNIPGNPKLKLTPSILADIFLLKIKKWNDNSIMAANPDIKLPNMNIVVVHRADGSGTTSIFTDYLSKVSPEWKQNVGAGKSVKWPGGVGGKGNEGVSGYVKQIKGSIGYAELAYTIQNNMPQAYLQNPAGNFVKPTLESTSIAADVNIPSDTRTSLTNSVSEGSYPISGFTWIIIYKEQKYDNRTLEKSQALIKLLSWMITDGQKYATPLDYSPLPKIAAERATAILKSITFDGKAILQ